MLAHDGATLWCPSSIADKCYLTLRIIRIGWLTGLYMKKSVSSLLRVLCDLLFLDEKLAIWYSFTKPRRPFIFLMNNHNLPLLFLFDVPIFPFVASGCRSPSLVDLKKIAASHPICIEEVCPAQSCSRSLLHPWSLLPLALSAVLLESICSMQSCGHSLLHLQPSPDRPYSLKVSAPSSPAATLSFISSPCLIGFAPYCLV